MKTMTQRFQTLLSVSNFSLAITALLMLLSIIVAYPMADYFSLPIQIFAHISTIIVAGLLKISYVGRCVAQYSLGQEVR